MKLSSLLSDGMVLQRNQRNLIWGKSIENIDGNLTVRNSSDGSTLNYVFKTDEDGNFDVSIDEFSAGGPYSIYIKCKDDEATINDVYFGDVFLLTGQSNMELPVRRTLDLTEEYCKKIDNNLIRHFEVPKEVDFDGPVDDIYAGAWKVANQENLYSFSALGFFFAEIVNEKQNVPVGLIQTACGGIQIEALIEEKRLLNAGRILREEALKRGETKENNCICGKNHSCKFCYEEVITNDKSKEYREKCEFEDTKENYDFYNKINNEDIGLKNYFFKLNSLYSENEEVKKVLVPKRWESKDKSLELEFVRGSVWLLKRFNVPEEYIGKSAKLYMGTIIDADDIYINGIKVGHTDYRYPPRRYEVKEGILQKENTIVVRVIVSQRNGGFVPEMPYYLKLEENCLVPLDGEYEYKIGINLNESFDENPVNLNDSTFFLYRPCGMYNKMIYPLRKLKLKGMAFYQGESNAMYYKDYELLMKEMIAGIRECFNDKDLKVCYVQLPYFGQEDNDRGSDLWDQLRLVQAKCQDIEGTAMVYTYDLGFTYELHPQNKKDVAKRLYDKFSKLIY